MIVIILLGIILLFINLLLAVAVFYAIRQYGDMVEESHYGYIFTLIFGANVVYILQSLV